MYSPREGAVLCVEVLITAGPTAEIWQRDKQSGEAVDMRGSEWEKQTLAWAKREWGDNLVAMKLHQDEKTPHFQGFAVPILGKDGGLAGEVNLENSKGARLSARDMFSPQTLSQLQTDFAEAMQPFGLERGIKGSRAEHKTMRQMYALGGEKAAEIAPLINPIEPQPFVLATPPRSLFAGTLEEWRTEQQEEINAEIARQVKAVNERLGAVGAVAVVASGAAEESERSRTWAGDSLQKADAARNEAKRAQDEVEKEASQAQAERERHAAELDKVLLQVAQGALPADLLQRGQDLVAQQMADLRQAWPVPADLRAQADQAEKAGDYGLVAKIRYGKVPEAEQQVAHYRELVQVTPAGRALIAELEAADRAARALEQEKAQQEAAAREKERVAEQERQAQVRSAEQARRVQEQAAKQAAEAQRVVQEEAAKKARQEAAEQAAAAARAAYHRDTEMARLETARRANLGRGEVVRVRVLAAEVGLMQALIGSSAVPDAEPGADGRLGVNIFYNPNSTAGRVTQLVERVRATGGEVFERPQDASYREQSTRTELSRAQSFGRSRDKQQGQEYEM